MSRMNHPVFLGVVTVAVVCAVAGCTSRYRLDLHMTIAEQRKKVKVESTEYVRQSQLNEAHAVEKLIAGESNCIILHLGTRGEAVEVNKESLMKYDEYLRCRLYAQLPSRLEPESITLVDNSFVHLLGRYQLQPEDKIFMPVSGELVVDSLSKNHLYATINGVYRSRADDSIGIDGSFKIKVRN